MSQKKLMLLGGIRYLLPVIDAAHKMGVYVITADYLPDNIAHKYSDEYVNVSIIDRDAVLKVAQEKQIDGILSFGVDPGVVTAAYVAEKLGLPSPPLRSVEILQNKDKFRDFLVTNGFNCPFHRGYSSKQQALSDKFDFPVIVKPVDSAGSKGCSRVDSPIGLPSAIDIAISESHKGRFIIEQFLEKAYASSDTDGFSINDELVFCSFNCQHFDARSPNPYTPAAFIWPSEIPVAAQMELRGEIQRLIKILRLGTSIYNVETRVSTDGRAYIMELSPRGGGNRLSEILEMATGQSLIANTIRYALGMPLASMHDPVYDGVWAEIVIHSNAAGKYAGLRVSDDVYPNIIQEDMWVTPGDHVDSFTGANATIGTIVLRFATREEADERLCNIDQWLRVIVE